LYRVSAEMVGIPAQQGKCVNVFHLQCGSTPTVAQVTNAVAVIGAFYTAIKDRLATTTSTTVGARVIQFDTAAPHVGTPIGATPVVVVGGDTNPSMPARTCAVVSWTTGHTGRSFRGRTYISGIGIDVYTSGSGGWNSTMQGAWTTAANTMVSTLQGMSPIWSLQVYSRARASSDAVTSGIVRGRVCTQRDRG